MLFHTPSYLLTLSPYPLSELRTTQRPATTIRPDSQSSAAFRTLWNEPGNELSTQQHVYPTTATASSSSGGGIGQLVKNNFSTSNSTSSHHEYHAQHTHERRWMEQESIDIIVRSHRLVPSGYLAQDEDKIWTVFSARDYKGMYMNTN